MLYPPIMSIILGKCIENKAKCDDKSDEEEDGISKESDVTSENDGTALLTLLI